MTSRNYFKKICKNLNSYQYTDEYKKGKKQIEKDLEALELLKKYYKSNGWSNGGVIQFWEMTEPELKKVNERLENERNKN